MNNKVQYYKDLVCKKIDQGTDAFITRIEARRRGDCERVEFLEKVVLEPLNKQINYLANKTVQLLGGDRDG